MLLQHRVELISKKDISVGSVKITTTQYKKKTQPLTQPQNIVKLILYAHDKQADVWNPLEHYLLCCGGYKPHHVAHMRCMQDIRCDTK